jgi:hypothetical protein
LFTSAKKKTDADSRLWLYCKYAHIIICCNQNKQTLHHVNCTYYCF